MYSNRDKIVKKANEQTTEIEDEVAKAFFELENKKVDSPEDIKKVKLCSARYYSEGDKKVLHVTVPYPLFALVRKNYLTIVPYLENKFKCTVALTARRTILSKYEKRKGSEKRPYSRTLTSVHNSYLEDIIYPYEILGRRIRVKVDGTQIFKIHLKEEDRKGIEGRLEALALLYKTMTNRILSFEFVKGVEGEKKKKPKKDSRKEGKKKTKEEKKE
eukprot:TRINITY_DN0_c1444_g1_i3.p1 TRINITY_DN0_c1444_g1~~TRINITY_DN0_c1444_g1_i3.p1  ORF type:complete len:216 (-),score=109.80 TRINITY_DN0_c1444_g1_i3:54-701(-)